MDRLVGGGHGFSTPSRQTMERNMMSSYSRKQQLPVIKCSMVFLLFPLYPLLQSLLFLSFSFAMLAADLSSLPSNLSSNAVVFVMMALRSRWRFAVCFQRCTVAASRKHCQFKHRIRALLTSSTETIVGAVFARTVCWPFHNASETAGCKDRYSLQ